MPAMPTMPVGGSISASVSVPGSMSAPVSLPSSNMFSGFTSTPFLPASSYYPSTFGAPTTAFGSTLPTPMASSVSSLPLGTYGAGSYGAMTSIPRATYAPSTYGSTYPSYGPPYGAPTTYAAP